MAARDIKEKSISQIIFIALRHKYHVYTLVPLMLMGCLVGLLHILEVSHSNLDQKITSSDRFSSNAPRQCVYISYSSPHLHYSTSFSSFHIYG
jgi:hypothetical protein